MPIVKRRQRTFWRTQSATSLTATMCCHCKLTLMMLPMLTNPAHDPYGRVHRKVRASPHPVPSYTNRLQTFMPLVS